MDARLKIIRGNPEPFTRFAFRCIGHLDDEKPVRSDSRETVLNRSGPDCGLISEYCGVLLRFPRSR